MIKNKKNGLLVENTVEDWYKAICYAIDHIGQMKENVKTAQKQLREEFSLAAIQNDVHSEIDSIITVDRIKTVVNYKHAHLRELLYETSCRWHQFSAHVYREGIIETIKKIIHHKEK